MGHTSVNIGAGQAALKTTGPGRSVSRALPTKFFNGYVYNTSAADVYIQVFDATSLPANASVPTLPPIKCPAGSNASLDIWGGHSFGTGLTIAASSTDDTLTIVTADDCWIFATYR